MGLEFNTAAGTVEHDDDGNGRDSKDDGSVEQFDKVAPKMICCRQDKSLPLPLLLLATLLAGLH